MANTPQQLEYWQGIPRDYRSVINGERYVLHYNWETGATELWPLSAAWADMIERYQSDD
jgi:hypothetical protein